MKKSISIILVCLFSLLLGFILFEKIKIDNGVSVNNQTSTSQTEPEKTQDTVALLVPEAPSSSSIMFSPLAITIDNNPGAYPIVGLNQAEIVVEAPAEGDITRFLAFFDIKKIPQKIGPVRSIRPYFLDLAEDYRAVLAHAGGSPEALARLKVSKNLSYDLNEISRDGIYFWRDKSRKMPFNTYTGENLISQLLKNKKIDLPVATFFSNFPTSTISGEKAVSATIKYFEPVTWLYQENADVYLRFRSTSGNANSVPYREETGQAPSTSPVVSPSTSSGQVQTKNLVFLKTDVETIDKIGRKAITLIGRGEAVILSRGYQYKAEWRRDKNNPLKFYNLDGDEFQFVLGQIFIEISNELPVIAQFLED